MKRYKKLLCFFIVLVLFFGVLGISNPVHAESYSEVITHIENQLDNGIYSIDLSDIDDVSSEDINDAGECLMYASDKYYSIPVYFGFYHSFWGDESNIEFYPVCSEEKAEKYVNKITKSFLKEIHYKELSDEEIIRKVHDYIIDRVEYDDEFEDADDKTSDADTTVYGALHDKRAICVGYARTFYHFMCQCDIPCGIVLTNDHCWNVVKVNGKWKSIDTCWGEGLTDKYYLIGLGKMEKYYGDDYVGYGNDLSWVD